MENNKTSQERVETAKKIASKAGGKSVYETLEESIMKFFRWISSLLDSIFFSSKYLGLFALVLACMAYFVATYDSNSTTLSSSKVLSNVAVTPRYNSETFELSGVPASCEIVLTGEAANVTNAASKKGYCQLNLEGYTEGTHTVTLNAVGYGDNVNAVVSPNEVTIVLKKKTTAQFDLSYDFINQNSMDARFILSAPVFSSGTKINIRASQDTLNSIALVKALIDVSGHAEDFEIEAPLVAYDKNGKVVNAEIVPSTVKAMVSMSSPSKDVEIKLNVTGQPPVGLAIDTVQMVDHQTTRIYASENVLSTINEVYVNFDMSTVTENAEKEIMLPVILPANVSASDVTVVNLKVSLTTVATRTIENIPLQYRNNSSNLAVSDIDMKNANVTASGSEGNIASITENDIVVYFDMPSEAGTYNLPLYVENHGNPYVNLALEKASINITLVEAGQ